MYTHIEKRWMNRWKQILSLLRNNLLPVLET